MMSVAEEYDELPLSAAHRHKLFDEAGISAEVAAARGYQSIYKETHGASYRENGWGSLVARMPALEIPIWTVQGRAACPQIRPDSPRQTAGGKVVKYEWPQGEALRLDVNPLLIDRIKGTEPLIITEGVIKSDAAISRGLCCIGLLGVYGFRGRNIHGGLTAFDDWQYINLRGRDVYIAFDSDVVQKPQVQRALNTLRTFLIGKGAVVHTTYLPEGTEGAKVGLDDYFAAGHTVEEFWSLAGEPGKAGAVIETKAAEFVVIDGRINLVRETDQGRIATPLCNFTATVRRAIAHDDGMVVRRALEISGQTDRGETLPIIIVPTDEYDSMSWVTECWHGKAIVQPGKSAKDALRAAILELSSQEQPVQAITAYSHVGWRKIEDDWVYLSASGGLDANGLDDTITVTPDGSLALIELRDVTYEQRVAGVRASLDLINVGKADLFAPLLAATYLAPLAEILKPNFVVHLVGHTGSLKTETAALMQGHFGAKFNAQCLPGSWLSTANYMEHQAFAAKDCVIVMDDFRPNDGVTSIAMHQKAETFIRGVGNVAGRGRLNADASAKKTYYSRGIVLSTGEDSPQGESLRARMAILEFSRRDIDIAKLTEAQYRRDTGLFVDAMSGYIKWLAGQYDDLGEKLRLRHVEILRKFSGEAARSLRTPYICAMLLLGFEVFLEYARKIDAITQQERDTLQVRAEQAIMLSMPAQAGALAEEDESYRFINAVQSGLLAGRCHLRSISSLGWEDGLEQYGWTVVDHDNRRPQGVMVGYVDFHSKCVLLLPEEAYNFMVSTAQRSGRGMGLSKRRLWKNLDEAGLLTRSEKDYYTVRKKVNGPNMTRVLMMSPKAFMVNPTPDEDEVIAEYGKGLEAQAE